MRISQQKIDKVNIMQTSFTLSESILESQVFIDNQKWTLKLSQDLKLFKMKKSIFNCSVNGQTIQICEIRQDLTLSFNLIFESQKNINSQKIGLQVQQNGFSVLKCLFMNHNEVQQWEQILKSHIPQTRFHQHFKALRVLGKGTEGTVYLTKSLQDNKLYAIKGIPKQKLDSIPNGKIGIINEIKILRKINNQNIMKFYGIWESDNTYYLQLSYETGHSLFDILKQMKRPMEKIGIKKILIDSLKALDYLSSKRVLHRDLKPQNIIVNSEKTTILDFGLATEADLDYYIFTKCGTPGFIAPEIANLKFHEHIQPKCDVFSLGAIFHILLTGRLLFQGNNVNQMIAKNRECEYNLNDSFYEQFDQQGMDLLKKMLAIDPEDRINAREALSHSYFN